MPRRIVVHSLAQAEAAVAVAAELGVDVTLVSPPAAAGYLGPAWWLALLAQAGVGSEAAVLDCGDAPGHALAAMRAGVRRLRVEAAADVLARLGGIAAARGARLDADAAPALDLGPLPPGRWAAACRDWLSG